MISTTLSPLPGVVPNNPAGSHVLVLEHLFQLFPGRFKRIVEFGMGYFSTPTLLRLLPEDGRLLSYETDGRWEARVRRGVPDDKPVSIKGVGNDSRWTPVLLAPHEMEIAALVRAYGPSGFDLAFIDSAEEFNGRNRPAGRRSAVLGAAHGLAPIVVVHDYQIDGGDSKQRGFSAYHGVAIAAGWQYAVCFLARHALTGEEYPGTGVLTDDPEVYARLGGKT